MANQHPYGMDPAATQKRSQTIRDHMPLINYLVERMLTQVPHFVTRDDLVSAAMSGLLDAVGRFDPERGVMFKTFAERRIRGAIMDEVRRMDWFSRTMREKQQRLSHAMADMEQRLGRPPREEEVAEAMGMSLEEYQHLLSQVSHLGCVSLHETLDDSEEGHTFLESLADDKATDAQEVLENSEMVADLVSHLEALSEKERLVVSLYYYEELTQKEIASVLEVTEGRISQLHSQALAKLRGRMASA